MKSCQWYVVKWKKQIVKTRCFKWSFFKSKILSYIYLFMWELFALSAQFDLFLQGDWFSQYLVHVNCMFSVLVYINESVLFSISPWWERPLFISAAGVWRVARGGRLKRRVACSTPLSSSLSKALWVHKLNTFLLSSVDSFCTFLLK